MTLKAELRVRAATTYANGDTKRLLLSATLPMPALARIYSAEPPLWLQVTISACLEVLMSYVGLLT